MRRLTLDAHRWVPCYDKGAKEPGHWKPVQRITFERVEFILTRKRELEGRPYVEIHTINFGIWQAFFDVWENDARLTEFEDGSL